MRAWYLHNFCLCSLQSTRTIFRKTLSSCMYRDYAIFVCITLIKICCMVFISFKAQFCLLHNIVIMKFACLQFQIIFKAIRINQITFKPTIHSKHHEARYSKHDKAPSSIWRRSRNPHKGFRDLISWSMRYHHNKWMLTEGTPIDKQRDSVNESYKTMWSWLNQFRPR